MDPDCICSINFALNIEKICENFIISSGFSYKVKNWAQIICYIKSYASQNDTELTSWRQNCWQAFDEFEIDFWYVSGARMTLPLKWIIFNLILRPKFGQIKGSISKIFDGICPNWFCLVDRDMVSIDQILMHPPT